MKILFVLEHYHPFIGGAEVLFKQLCEGLADKGHEITVITSRLPQTTETETVNGVKILRIKTPLKASRYWFTFLAIPTAIRLANEADIIHTTTYNGAFPAWLASKLRSKKCIITVHEIIGEGWKKMMGMGWFMAWMHQLLERVIVLLPFDRYVSVSQYTATRIQRSWVKPEKISVIYNGIDYDFFNPEKADGNSVRYKLNLNENFVYMYYGRPGISKGVEYLIQAVPLISVRISSARLLIILGKEPADGYEKIVQMIKSLKVSEKVILLNPVPRAELPSYIAAADCVVVPSISEGFGFTASEACSMGKPVVVSNVASLPEIISGKHVLVEPANPRSIAIGVEDVYNNRVSSTAEKLFTWEECINKYLNIYNKMIR